MVSAPILQVTGRCRWGSCWLGGRQAGEGEKYALGFALRRQARLIFLVLIISIEL